MGFERRLSADEPGMKSFLPELSKRYKYYRERTKGYLGFVRFAASLEGARFTAHQRVLPGAFLLGGMKCASTSLSTYLTIHPGCVGPILKETQYLSAIPGFFGDMANKGPFAKWMWHGWKFTENGYKRFFPRATQLQQASKNLGRDILVVDTDPFNLYCGTAARRVKELVPDASFIVCLRDPVERAYSDYAMNRLFDGRLKEKRTFEQAVDDELSGKSKFIMHRYLFWSTYEPPLREWMTLFDRYRFLIVDFDDVCHSLPRVVQEMYHFLGLAPFRPGRFPLENRGQYDSEISEETVGRLREHFAPHDERLCELTGRTFGWMNSRA